MSAVPKSASYEETTIIDLEANPGARPPSLEAVDDSRELPFDSVVALAAQVTNRPIAVITLVDSDRQWFKASHGLRGLTAARRNISFCDHAIREPGLFEVVDAPMDPRFASDPLVAGEPFIRHIAAMPLRIGGHAVGTLCVLDRRKGRLGPQERVGLERAALAATRLLQARRPQNAASHANTEVTREFDEVLVVDALSLKIRHVSAAALARLGYSMAEVEGCDVSLIGTEYPQELLNGKPETIPPQGRRIDTEHRQKDGTHYRVSARVHLRQSQSAATFLILANRVER
jgi:PAS domain-containing protein